MPMRWRWPPENSWGKRLANSGSSPTSRRAFWTSSSRSASSRYFFEVDDALGDYVVDLGPLVEGGHRVLEDHLDLLDDFRVEFLGYPAVYLPAFEENLARAGLRYPHDAPAYRGLAGAGFSHEAEGLALPDMEVNVLDRREHPAPDGKVHPQVPDLEKDFLAAVHASLPAYLARIAWMAGGGSSFGARGSSSQVAAQWLGLIRIPGRLDLEVYLEGLGVAGREGVALDVVEEVGRGARDGVERLSLYARAGAGRTGGPRCRDAADRRRLPPRSPAPRSVPAYITATRSATLATTPRSWVM